MLSIKKLNSCQNHWNNSPSNTMELQKHEQTSCPVHVILTHHLFINLTTDPESDDSNKFNGKKLIITNIDGTYHCSADVSSITAKYLMFSSTFLINNIPEQEKIKLLSTIFRSEQFISSANFHPS